jgi:hypothetical protein
VWELFLCDEQGSFVDNQFEGEGVYQWADGARYIGSWHQNKYVLFQLAHAPLTNYAAGAECTARERTSTPTT